MEETITIPPPLPPKTKYRSPLITRPSPTTVKLNSDDFRVSSSTAIVAEEEEERSKSHVVKIVINPQKSVQITSDVHADRSTEIICDVSPCIRISVNSDTEVIQNNSMDGADRANPYYFFNRYNGCAMSSGQISPSETLDSGTCSDLDGTPPPMPKMNGAGGGGVTVTLIGSHKRTRGNSASGVEADSDDNESGTSSISCDSLNFGKFSPANSEVMPVRDSSILPQTLLQDIRQRNMKFQVAENSPTIVDEKSYEERKKELTEVEKVATKFDTDSFYEFHLNEKVVSDVAPLKSVVEDETFAGLKDYLLGNGAATIRSAKGTVRGVKNRVRAGIATFLQINDTAKNFKEKDAGKVVVYTTTMGIVRDTYQACMKVKQILRTLLVKFEERDVFMSSEYQAEIRERIKCEQILVPQLFVDGQHIGDTEIVERLNESGELRKILKPYKSADACSTCQTCGGYRLLPCPVCNGSKKSVHRNHFTAEFVALKCMNCDEVGLVRCSSC